MEREKGKRKGMKEEGKRWNENGKYKEEEKSWNKMRKQKSRTRK